MNVFFEEMWKKMKFLLHNAGKIKSTKLITFKFSKPDPNKNVCTSIPRIQKDIR